MLGAGGAGGASAVSLVGSASNSRCIAGEEGMDLATPISSPAALGKGGEPAATMVGAHSREGLWASVNADHLVKLIMDQIPRFKQRPYLKDATGLRASLASGLDASLEGDFCWSLCFSPTFIQELCYEGFLPISCELGGGTGLFVLLPKLHAQRCVLRFSDLHVPRKLRRRNALRGYSLRVSEALDDVMAGCLAQHGASWLHPPLRTAFAQMRAADATDAADAAIDAAIAAAPAAATGSAATLAAAPSSEAATAASPTPSEDSPASSLKMCAFALLLDGELVAGEFGALCGRSYTSYSGFHSHSGAGTIQMLLTAKLLQSAGFGWWDMGQEHAYKLLHGAQLIDRQTFLEEYRQHRARPNALAELCSAHGGSAVFSAEELMAPVSSSGGSGAAPASDST